MDPKGGMVADQGSYFEIGIPNSNGIWPDDLGEDWKKKWKSNSDSHPLSLLIDTIQSHSWHPGGPLFPEKRVGPSSTFIEQV